MSESKDGGSTGKVGQIGGLEMRMEGNKDSDVGNTD